VSKAEEIIAILNMEIEDGGDLEHFVLRLQENRDLITRALRLEHRLHAPVSHFTSDRLSEAFMQHLSDEWPEAHEALANAEPVVPRAISSAIGAVLREAVK
jgi:hypothetical protein